MPKFQTQGRSGAAEFRRNAATNRSLASNNCSRSLDEVEAGGSEEARARHRERDKLPGTRRASRSCSIPSTPWLEIGKLAAHGVYDVPLPAAGLVCGVGTVRGVRCMVVANDATVKGGTYYPLTVKKHLRAQEIALENRLPCVYLVDSGGAFLPLQDEVFPDRDHFGRIFYNQAQLSARGIAADRGRHGLVHGRRRVRAGDVRRDDHRQGARHDLSRRAAARESGDRRRRRRRDARRRRRAHADLGRRGSSGERRRARARARARHRRAGDSRRARRSRTQAPTSTRSIPPRSSTGSSPRTCATSTTCARCSRASSTRSELDEFKARYGTTIVCAFARALRSSRSASSRTTAFCSRSPR